MRLNRTTTRPISGVRQGRRGAAAVELALAMPLLIILLLGVWDLGRLIDVTQILNNATREGGRCASTGQVDTPEIQQAVLSYLTQAGISTNGVTITVTNLTTPANTSPLTADQLDRFQITTTLPSANVRWIALNSLPGVNTLTATSIWSSMRDIPLIVPSSIPVN